MTKNWRGGAVSWPLFLEYKEELSPVADGSLWLVKTGWEQWKVKEWMNDTRGDADRQREIGVRRFVMTCSASFCPHGGSGAPLLWKLHSSKGCCAHRGNRWLYISAVSHLPSHHITPSLSGSAGNDKSRCVGGVQWGSDAGRCYAQTVSWAGTVGGYNVEVGIKQNTVMTGVEVKYHEGAGWWKF